MCEGVGFLRLRYYDGERWSASFDSGAAGALPVAVEVAVWFGPPGPREEADEAGGGTEAAESPEKKRTEKRENEGTGQERAGADRIARAPDRVRLIVAPDGPVSSWKELR
jgi:hypothetical protein